MAHRDPPAPADPSVYRDPQDLQEHRARKAPGVCRAHWDLRAPRAPVVCWAPPVCRVCRACRDPLASRETAASLARRAPLDPPDLKVTPEPLAPLARLASPEAPAQWGRRA